MEQMNIPPKGKSTGRKPKYNFQSIEVGGSQYYEDRAARAAAATYATHRNKHRTEKEKIKFVARVTGAGITVYRIA